jgi:transcriptional regulator with XRE-family HTH domain
MDDNEKAQIGNRIRERRELLGITQEEAAESSSLDVGHFSRIERGLKVPSLPALYRISRTLGVAPGELLHDPGNDGENDPASRAIQELLATLTQSQRKAVLRALQALLRHPNS